MEFRSNFVLFMLMKLLKIGFDERSMHRAGTDGIGPYPLPDEVHRDRAREGYHPTFLDTLERLVDETEPLR